MKRRFVTVASQSIAPPVSLALIVVLTMSLVLGLSSCSWGTHTQTSVVVIMVENLGVGAFSCAEGAESLPANELDASADSGFQIFCDEAVRFTHAYTPSVLSQPTIASILTAKYPFEHGVRHNGAQALSAKEVTVSEVAVQHGFRTGFFSGGPPIWRRSGFSQGFEIFDDSVMPTLSHLYRPAAEVVNLFLNWQANDAAKKKFFSFIYLADPQFIDIPTQNQLGEIRESSYNSQLAAVDEALAKLIRQMKARKIWDSSDVYLVGLGANSAEGRDEEIPPMNLFSESTRVTLMIKPSRKTRDGPFNWKIDSNVSLTDVGATLYDRLGVWTNRKDSDPPTPSTAGEHLVVSLKSALKGPEPAWPADRMIVSESAWTQWQGLGGIRASVRQGPTFFLYDEKSHLYDTLTDNLEVIPLPSGNSRSILLRAKFSDFLRDHGYLPWRSPGRAVAEKVELASELWRDRLPDKEILARLRTLSNRHPGDEQLKGWRAIFALRENDWKELKDLAGIKQKGRPLFRPLWSFVADRNLGRKVAPPPDPCFAFLKGQKRLPRTCDIEGLRDLMAWADEKIPEVRRSKAAESFIKFYLTKALAIRIAEQNQVVGLTWDASLKIQEPDTLELILALPEMKRIRHIVKLRVSSVNR